MDAIDAKALPARPSLEQYKKQAKDLVKACRAGDPEALRRIDHQHPRHEPDPGRRWTLSDAQFAIAREYGFVSWTRFTHHLAGLASGTIRSYEAAADAIVEGDLGALEALLDSDSGLVRRRSTRTHGGTLLHYVAANGVEPFRQKTPPNAVEIAELLLRNDAEPDATAFMYSEQATTMEMLVSSAHPYDAGVQVDLVHTLLDFGAAVDGPAGDGAPLLTAVLFQYVEAAEALAGRGARVDSVVTAAGLGRDDLVREFVDDDGVLKPTVRPARLRAPRPTSDPRVNVEWALICAATLGHTAVVDVLSERGTDLTAKGPAGFTALHWAAVHGRRDIVELLLERGAGAALEDTDNHHHSTVLGCAIWAATNGSTGASTNAVAVVERLLAAGARTDRITEPTGNAAIDDLLSTHPSR